MNEEEKRVLIDKYLQAYNTFDIEGMLAAVTTDIEFRNMAQGEVNAQATGKEDLRRLAEQSKGLFSSRKQTLTRFAEHDDRATINVDFEGILAVDLPNGMKKGATLKISGRTDFRFKEGKIREIIDVS